MRRAKKKEYDYKKTLRDNERKNKVASKNSKIDITPKDEVKDMFISWFRKNKSIGQVMSKENVVRDILTKLDIKLPYFRSLSKFSSSFLFLVFKIRFIFHRIYLV